MGNLNIAIIHAVPLFRLGLRYGFHEASDFEIVIETSEIDDALALARVATLDVAICDATLPMRRSLVQGLRDLGSRTLVLSCLEDPDVIAALLHEGASGCALQSQSVAEIIGAVRCVAAGERYVPPRISRASIEAAGADEARSRLARLTSREREVLELVVQGFSNEEIASQLFISPRTAETHKHNIVKKLGTSSLAEAQRLVAICDALWRIPTAAVRAHP